MKRTHNPGTWILFSFLNQVLFKIKNRTANSPLWEELGDRDQSCITCWALFQHISIASCDLQGRDGAEGCYRERRGGWGAGDEGWSGNLGILSALQYWKCLILFKYKSNHIHVHTEPPSYLTPINPPPQKVCMLGETVLTFCLSHQSLFKNLSILPSLESVALSHLDFQKLKITFKSWLSQEACMVGIGSWVVPLSEGGVNCVSTNHIQMKSASRSHHCSYSENNTLVPGDQ